MPRKGTTTPKRKGGDTPPSKSPKHKKLPAAPESESPDSPNLPGAEGPEAPPTPGEPAPPETRGAKRDKVLETQLKLAELQLQQATKQSLAVGKLQDHQKLRAKDSQDYVKVAQYLHRQSKDVTAQGNHNLAELLRVGAPDLALPNVTGSLEWWDIASFTLNDINSQYLTNLERIISSPTPLTAITVSTFHELKHQCTLTVDSFLWLVALSKSGHTYGGRDTLLHRMILNTLPTEIQRDIGVHLLDDDTVEKLVTIANHTIQTAQTTKQPRRFAPREETSYAALHHLERENDQLKRENDQLKQRKWTPLMPAPLGD